MSTTLEELYELGKKLFDEGKLGEAEPLLREVISRNPRYADVHNKMGIICSMKGELKKAADHFEKALELNPRYTEASLNLAVTYNDLGRYEKASAAFQSAARVTQTGTGALDR